MGRFFIVQGLSLVLSWAVVRWGMAESWWLWVVTQALLAVSVSVALRHPRWWILLHLAFVPGIALFWVAHLSRGWYGFGFIGLLALYWSTFRTRVPLYLTHQKTLNVLIELVDQHQPHHFVDLGCGTGTVLKTLARHFPQVRFQGWEVAPLPWLLAKLGTWNMSNCHIVWGSFWKPTLNDADMVYAFLSPVPMPALWMKVSAEMKEGAILVSNSFSVPGVSSWQEKEGDTAMPLYLYQPNPPDGSQAVNG